MISVIIATNESEQLLVPTLSALVPGAMAGIVREVIVADAGSRDATAAVADIAGCDYVVTPGPVGARLKTAAAAARGSWLMFLRPGSLPDVTWVQETGRFILEAERAAGAAGLAGANAQAAVFRHVSAGNSRSAIREAMALIAVALGARPRPEQGLLIAKAHYDGIGGHRADRADAETDLLHRIGRRRIVPLRSSVTAAVP